MTDMLGHIHESNLIEGFDDPAFDSFGLGVWCALLENINKHLDAGMIMTLHKSVTFLQGELSDSERGAYRQRIVTVGGRICPRPFVVPALMDNWLLDMNENWRTLEPKKMHIRFEKIHPFVDGNGRLGRLLMWWHEVKLGREPTLIKNSEKEKYYEWFR